MRNRLPKPRKVKPRVQKVDTPRSNYTDPLLGTHHWKFVVRPYHVRNRKPCARCGGEIDYTSPRYYPGTRKVNPATLVVGHIVSRVEAKAMGWTDAQINAISNTQPEHALCSDRSGANYTNTIKRNLRLVQSTNPSSLDTSRKW